MVMTMKKPSSHSQLASGAPADCQAAPTMIRLASATPKQPSDILVTVEGSLPRRACHAHSATMNGVKAKIINGLKAWNQVVGISPRDPGCLGLVQLVGRQRPHRVEIDCECDRHADAGGGEAVVPAQLLAERPADQRREERAEIDPHIEGRIGAVAPPVAG